MLAAMHDDLSLTAALATSLLPHLQIALTSAFTVNEAADALKLMKRSASAPISVSSPRSHVVPTLSQGCMPRYTVRRVITCPTYLKRLHVTEEMVKK